MKKTLLLTIALLLNVTLFSQSVGTIVKETFDSEEMPEGWKITGGQAQNWSVSESNFCGGDPNEIKMNYTPIFYNGFTRLTSPMLDLTDVDSILVTFKHYVDIYTTYPSTIGIATSSTNGMNWTVCYEETFYSDGRHNISKVISGKDMNKNNVMVAIFYNGNSANLNAIYFDDVEITTIENINAKTASIDIPNSVDAGNTDITFSLQNLGTEKITSFEANYEVDGITYSQTFETEIDFIETKQFTFDQNVTLIPGNYEVKIDIVSVNGKDDKDATNNTLTKNINVALGSVQRLPMIEHFSSSTCSYCVDVDNSMNALTNDNPGKYTYVKYPLNFPAPGDPYNTEECNIKKEYYGVTAAPRVILNGENLGSSAVSQYQLDESYNTKSYVNIKGAFNIEDKTINIKADIMSYINLKNVKLFVCVNEKTTTGNVGTNGLTEFHHVMMKMLPDVNGKDIEMKAGEYQHYEFSYNMGSTFVEDMNDLEVAVWVQDIVTSEVFNSSFLYEYTEHKYPAQNLTMTENDDHITIAWEAPEKGEPTAYNLYFNNELVLNNTKEMSFNTTTAEDFYMAEVVALYDDKKSVGIIKTSVTEEEIIDTTNVISNYENRFNIYPNPVEDELTITTELRVEEIAIYDIYGRQTMCQQVNETTSQQVVNVAGLNSGIYFVRITTEDGEIVKRFVKN